MQHQNHRGRLLESSIPAVFYIYWPQGALSRGGCVQEACLQVPQEEYNARVQDVVAQIPIKAANNTPLSELGMQPSAPTGAEAPSPSGGSVVPPSAATPAQAHQGDPPSEVFVEARHIQDQTSAAAPEDQCIGCFAIALGGGILALAVFGC